jgi:putative copper export protein
MSNEVFDMIQTLLHSIITFMDITALCFLIGTSWFRLWLIRPADSRGALPGPFLDGLRRLLLFCLAALAVSSIGGLAQRASEMSGFGITAILPVLPTVLFKTHYGSIWFIRLAGLAAAWIIWLTIGRRRYSLFAAVLLLCAGAVIAFSRSDSGHAADSGDLSLQQIADWLHVLAAASWGGSLLVLAALISPSLSESTPNHRVIADIAGRFYILFGPALAVLVLTGLYTAWFQVGSFPALGASPYGRVLSAKLVLLLVLFIRYALPPQHGQDDSVFAMKFLRRTRVEALMILGILLCASMLTHQVPARHAAHTMPGHGHGMDMSKEHTY